MFIKTINSIGTQKFTQETGQELVEFFSNDSISARSAQTGYQKEQIKDRIKIKINSISDKL
jgi:hypothetical protein